MKRYRAGGGGGEPTSQTFSLKRNQTMFSQLAKRSSRVLPADLCSDHTHYVINQRSIKGFEEEQNHGGRRRDCFSLLYFGNLQLN